MMEQAVTRSLSRKRSDPCPSSCGWIATERNRYFTGKYMTARDFSDEQAFMLSRLRLQNRLFNGWGVVCGLDVHHHPDPECADRWVVVEPGIALDCCGEELVLPRKTAFELPFEERNEAFLLCLELVEEEIDCVPALYADGECDPKKLEANRIREVAHLRICDYDPEGDCWPRAHHDADAPCRNCDDESGPPSGCIDPVCPCGRTVPLALITPGHAEEGGGRSPFHIHKRDRPQLPPPPSYLTHIVHYNWPHGGSLSLEELRERRGELRVRFDRRLMERGDDRGYGLDEFTFVVEFETDQNTLQFLFREDYPVRLSEDGCTAIFTIDPEQLHGRRQNLGGSSVYIRLKCDFILDCNGNPVDGNHLRGRPPTGDGVSGGTFESWFNVLPESREDYEGRGRRR